MLHIIERFTLHVAVGAMAINVIIIALKYWIRRNAKVGRWISPEPRHLLVIAAVIVAWIFALREPFDIYHGNNSFIKSCFDQASWFVSGAGSAWLTWFSWRIMGKE
jgi:hypothetical protein